MTEIIRSKDNALAKLIRKLGSKKYRKAEKKFVIESRKLVEEAISSNASIYCLVLREGSEAFSRNIDTKYFTKELFDSISEMESPDGYMAVVNMEEAKASKGKKALLLDHIQDPGNLGTIVRSAEAFSFKDIYLYECVDLYNLKTLRASMGSAFRVNVMACDEADLIEIKKDYRLYGAFMDGKDYRESDFSDRTCLVIGNEGHGISKKIEDIIDERVSIKMDGKIESLNAAISASILMSQI